MSSNTLSQIPIFAPTQISGCQLWLDGADPTTLILSGTSITQWNDKSGNGNNATGYNNPTYSNNSVVLNGTTQYLTCPNVSYRPPNIFAVATNNSNVEGTILRKGQSTTFEFTIAPLTATTIRYELQTATPTVLAANPTVASTSGRQLYEMTYDNTTLTCYFNGSVVGTASGTGPTLSGSTRLFLGVIPFNNDTPFTAYLNGSLQELIIYTTTPTTSQRQLTEGYLAWKWGLQANLPSNHPYKNTPVYSTTVLPPQFRNIGTIPMGPSSSPFVFGFNPRSFSGMNIWLDGTDPNGNGSQPANGASISTWTDKSGSGNNATVGTSAPTYNSSDFSINLNGTNQNLLFTNPSNLAVNKAFIFFIVEKRQTASVQHFISGSSEGTNQNLQFGYQSEGAVLEFYASGKTILSMPAYTGNDPVRLWTCIYTGSQRSISLNGGASSSSGAFSQNVTSWTNGGIGRIYAGTIYDIYMPGKYFEYIFYNSLTTAQQQQVEGYLAWKWGLPSQLPSNHPYKNSPPGLNIPVVPTNRQLANGIWIPTNFSSCLMWLDAADRSTITGTSTVTAWRNKGTISVSANNTGTGAAGTCSSGSLTQNGLNIIRCPAGAGLSITFASPNQARAWFAVAKNTTQMSASVLYWAVMNQTAAAGQDNPFGPGAYVSGGNTYTMSIGPSGVTVTVRTVTAPEPFNVMNLYTWQASAVTTDLNTINVNGAPMTLNKSIVAASFRTDSVAYSINTPSYNTGADIAELIFYNRELTIAQRQTVEGYLAWKWGLQGSLPTNHPFKRWPPPP